MLLDVMRAHISVPLVLRSSEFHRVTVIVKWAAGRAGRDNVATIRFVLFFVFLFF